MEKEIYRGNILRLTETRIGEVTWEKVYLPPGVIIFPITVEGKIILIRERRPHENPPVRVKAISGILECDLGTPEENAQREMQEEIGFKARHMELLMKIEGTGTVNHEQYFFIARGLEPSKLPNPDGEEVIEALIEFTPDELRKSLMTDQIKWSLSTLGMLRLLETL